MSKPHLNVGVIGGVDVRVTLATAILASQKISVSRLDVPVKIEMSAPRYVPDALPIYIPDMTFYKVCKLSKNWAHHLSKNVGYNRTPFLFAYAAVMQPKPTQPEMLNIVAKFRNAIKNRSRVARLSRRWNYWDREATKYLRKYATIARRTNRKLPVDYNDLDLEYFNTL